MHRELRGRVGISPRWCPTLLQNYVRPELLFRGALGAGISGVLRKPVLKGLSLEAAITSLPVVFPFPSETDAK